jgi:hypothetical protein
LLQNLDADGAHRARHILDHGGIVAAITAQPVSQYKARNAALIEKARPLSLKEGKAVSTDSSGHKNMAPNLRPPY